MEVFRDIMYYKEADEIHTPCSSPANCSWLGSLSGVLGSIHCSETGLRPSAGVWFVKWPSNVTSCALHPLTQHPFCFPVISVLQHWLFVLVNSRTKPIFMCSVLFVYLAYERSKVG